MFAQRYNLLLLSSDLVCIRVKVIVDQPFSTTAFLVAIVSLGDWQSFLLSGCVNRT